MPRRRPDPETGLIPVDDVVEATPSFENAAANALDMEALPYPPPGSTAARRQRRPTWNDVRAGWNPGPRMMVNVQRDFMRDMVAVRVAQVDRNGNMLVPRSIEWEAVQAGSTVASEPFFIDERAAEALSRELMPLTDTGREAREWERRYEESRQEIRSLANQLEETRERCDAHADQVTFLRRTVRWLEQELRDANRERRGQFDPTVAPEVPTPSEFAG
jgi:hypothetical protein